VGATRTPQQGADTIVWLATAPDVPTGGFFQGPQADSVVIHRREPCPHLDYRTGAPIYSLGQWRHPMQAADAARGNLIEYWTGGIRRASSSHPRRPSPDRERRRSGSSWQSSAPLSPESATRPGVHPAIGLASSS